MIQNCFGFSKEPLRVPPKFQRFKEDESPERTNNTQSEHLYFLIVSAIWFELFYFILKVIMVT